MPRAAGSTQLVSFHEQAGLTERFGHILTSLGGGLGDCVFMLDACRRKVAKPCSRLPSLAHALVVDGAAEALAFVQDLPGGT